MLTDERMKYYKTFDYNNFTYEIFEELDMSDRIYLRLFAPSEEIGKIFDEQFIKYDDRRRGEYKAKGILALCGGQYLRYIIETQGTSEMGCFFNYKGGIYGF